MGIENHKEMMRKGAMCCCDGCDGMGEGWVLGGRFEAHEVAASKQD